MPDKAWSKVKSIRASHRQSYQPWKQTHCNHNSLSLFFSLSHTRTVENYTTNKTCSNTVIALGYSSKKNLLICWSTFLRAWGWHSGGKHSGRERSWLGLWGNNIGYVDGCIEGKLQAQAYLERASPPDCVLMPYIFACVRVCVCVADFSQCDHLHLW